MVVYRHRVLHHRLALKLGKYRGTLIPSAWLGLVAWLHLLDIVAIYFLNSSTHCIKHKHFQMRELSLFFENLRMVMAGPWSETGGMTIR